MEKLKMNDYEKLEFVHCAIQEGMNGNTLELKQALVVLEELREKHLQQEKK